MIFLLPSLLLSLLQLFCPYPSHPNMFFSPGLLLHHVAQTRRSVEAESFSHLSILNALDQSLRKTR
jgi:hypothetical protein